MIAQPHVHSLEDAVSLIADLKEQLRQTRERALLHSLRRILPRYWMTRLYVALSVLVSTAITLAEPSTLAHQLILGKGGAIGALCLVALGVVAVLALVDVAVNDLMPRSCDLPTARRYRHLVYVMLSIGLASLTFVIASRAGYTSLLWSYWLDAAAALLVAFLDLFARHREGRQPC